MKGIQGKHYHLGKAGLHLIQGDEEEEFTYEQSGSTAQGGKGWQRGQQWVEQLKNDPGTRET